MAETGESKLEHTRRALMKATGGGTARSTLVADFKSFGLMYAFMYALIILCWYFLRKCVILYAQIVPPIGLEPILEGF